MYRILNSYQFQTQPLPVVESRFSVYHFKTLFVIKSDIICISCKSRVCKFPNNSMDENYTHPEIQDQAPKVLWDFDISLIIARNALKAITISENFQCLILNLRTCTIVIHTIFWKFSKLRLTRPSGPIRYSILNCPCLIE